MLCMRYGLILILVACAFVSRHSVHITHFISSDITSSTVTNHRQDSETYFVLIDRFTAYSLPLSSDKTRSNETSDKNAPLLRNFHRQSCATPATMQAAQIGVIKKKAVDELTNETVKLPASNWTLSVSVSERG